MNRHVLKFDIRKPDPHKQLWNRQEEEERGEHHIQECIIETTNEIEKRNDETTLNDGRKRNKAREAEQGQKQKRRKLGTTSEPDAHEARTENSIKQMVKESRKHHDEAPTKTKQEGARLARKEQKKQKQKTRQKK